MMGELSIFGFIRLIKLQSSDDALYENMFIGNEKRIVKWMYIITAREILNMLQVSLMK